MPLVIDQNTNVRLPNTNESFLINHENNNVGASYNRTDGWNIYNTSREEIVAVPNSGAFVDLVFAPKNFGALSFKVSNTFSLMSATFNISKKSANDGISNRLSSVSGPSGEQFIMRWSGNVLSVAIDMNLGAGTRDARVQIFGEEF